MVPLAGGSGSVQQALLNIPCCRVSSTLRGLQPECDSGAGQHLVPRSSEQLDNWVGLPVLGVLHGRGRISRWFATKVGANGDSAPTLVWACVAESSRC